jgi:hypothetical protein
MSTKFVPKNNWIVHGPTVGTLPLVEITAANTRCLNLDDYIIISSNWTINFANFNTVGFG